MKKVTKKLMFPVLGLFFALSMLAIMLPQGVSTVSADSADDQSVTVLADCKHEYDILNSTARLRINNNGRTL